MVLMGKCDSHRPQQNPGPRRKVFPNQEPSHASSESEAVEMAGISEVTQIVSKVIDDGKGSGRADGLPQGMETGPQLNSFGF